MEGIGLFMGKLYHAFLMSEEILDAPSTAGSNVPEFSVAELAGSIKKSLEDQYGRVRVRGELSRVNIAGSGHIYTSLKDDKAVIDAVCWKGVASKLTVRPEEGLEVICVGKLTTYPGSSKYQIVIESLELAGEGALLKMLEERRKKLAAEGLFAPERKQELPFLPEIVGVVTSPTGAVIRDIIHRLEDRFPRNVLLWPVIVQGKGAAEQITAAINGFHAMDEAQRPDVLIVGRGGGSLEDLMAFNEENVVRAVAACSIPVISAVGHETDTTLIDYVADVRAPTPTGAAEMAVPVRANLRAQIMDDEQRMFSAMSRMVGEMRNQVEGLARGLGDPARLFEVKAQSLDHAGERLARVFEGFVTGKRSRLVELSAQIRHPRDVVAMKRQALARWGDQLGGVSGRLTVDAARRVVHVGQMLEAYSPKNVLQRGYAIVRDGDGRVLPDAVAARKVGAVEIEFSDGKAAAQVGGTGAVKKKVKPVGDGQASLF